MNDDDQTALTEFCPEAGHLQRMNFLTEDVGDGEVAELHALDRGMKSRVEPHP